MMVVSGTIILIIDACLAVILSLVMIIDSWMFVSGLFMLAASIMAFISSAFALGSFNPMYILVGPLLLILAAITLLAFEGDAIFVVIIGIALAAVSLLLFVLGWKDSVARYDVRMSGQHPSMQMSRPETMYAQVPAYGSPEPPSFLRVKK
jgi:hypothetical protein